MMKNWWRELRVFLISVFLLLLPLSWGFTQVPPGMNFEMGTGPIRIRADRMSYDRERDLYEAEGRVEIWQEDRKFTADRVLYWRAAHLAEAIGNVTLVQGPDVLRADRMVIDLDRALGVIIEGTLFLKQQNFYIHGEEIERVGENTYRVKRGSFTTCDGSWPAWRFTGEEALITIEAYATVSGATFQVKNVPLLYTPYLVFPVKTQRQSGFLIPTVSHSSTSGIVGNFAFFWAIAQNQDATFYLDIATRKGIGEGVEYRWARKRESSTFLYGYHTRESDAYREKYTEILDRKPDRWFAEILHSENFGGGLSGKMRLWGFSDRQYFKDYGRNFEERAMEQASSTISLTKNWERYSLSGELRYNVSLLGDNQRTLQSLPVVHFSGVQRRIAGTPLFFDFTSQYGYFWREEGTTGHLLNLSPRLSLPLKWKPYLEITPEFRLMESYYAYRNGQDGTKSRTLWQFQTTAATEFYRIFDWGWKEVPKIKHLIRPEVVYTYIPDVSQQEVPDYDAQIPKANAVTYSLTQRLIGKIVNPQGKGRYHEYAYLRLSQTVDLFEVNRPLSPHESRRPFGPIAIDFKLIGQKYFKVENNSSYDQNRGRFQNTYTQANVSDSRGDSLTLEHRWEYGGVTDQINGSLRVRIVSSLDASLGMRYSRHENKNLERSLGIHYRNQCWGLDVTFSETPETAGAPGERKVLFMLHLLGLGSFGQK